MIELISRTDVQNSFPKIASEIGRIQHSFYDVDALEWFKEQGNEQGYWHMYDFMQVPMLENDAMHKVLGHSYSDINSFVPSISNDLKNLFTQIDAEEFILLSFLRLDFFGTKESDYQPLQKAYSKLTSMVGRTNYEEAIKFHMDDLEEVLDVFFWLTRCDPNAAEYIFIFDCSQRFQLNFCKYGNIHIAEFGREIFSQSLLSSHGFHLIDGPEEDCFTDDGIIEGRTIPL